MAAAWKPCRSADLPSHPPLQTRLDEPRDATFLDRLSLRADSREGW